MSSLEAGKAPTGPAAATTTMEPRLAYVNDHAKNQQLITTKKYAKNVIVTSKYTIISFVPKTLFEFFRVVANVYFLLISLLQLSTTWSPTNRFTTAGPLIFVLFVTMVKQASEDIKRHQADEKQNNRKCRIINSQGETEMITWDKLEVGQLVCIENNEELPADIVVLATSEEEGRCFIETCNLDGETNLKRRIAVKPTAKITGWRELSEPILDQATVCAQALRLKGSIEYEQPNNQLYNFTGRILLENDGSVTALGPENIMLRGCGLRSCAFAVGLVIFTGAETKLLQNSRSAPSKQSKLYQTANRCMLLIFITMFVLCLVSAIVAAVWNNHNSGHVWYLPFLESNTFGDFVVNFFTFLILYNNLVPISLYVSLDIIKVLQAKYITADDDMMYDGFRAISRTSELNEELGQIEYIFSDKTGTLTCNIMEFRKCSIGGISYGFGTTEIGRAVAALRPPSTSLESGAVLQIESTEDVRRPVPAYSSSSTNSDDFQSKLEPGDSSAAMNEGDPVAAQVHYDPSIHFDDPSLLKHLAVGDDQAERIDDFLTLLSICHTVIPEVDKKTGILHYRASSPDEEALVKAAKCLGYNFVDPAPLTKVEITQKDFSSPVGAVTSKPSRTLSPITKTYTIVNVNEFNSTRKRMSVVAINEANQYVLYCKGADNMMLPRSIQDKHTPKVLAHLGVFAGEGLRTLVLAKRILTEEEYHTYNEQYAIAATALEDREAKLDAVAESIEKDMTVVGVTAIEDKLQDFVPATIFDLAQAGIKIWVLTGDREETAVNIGHACQLINDKMKLLYINQEQIDNLERQIEELYKDPAIQQLVANNYAVSENLAMVCDGKALVHIFPSKDAIANMSAEASERAKSMAAKLLDVASVCKALIACRVSPSQKAEIVNLVRKGSPSKPITLAIGDGANDVSMIQTAHVGVGICGKEGVQAVNASDYAIAQFHFLKRLVLVHGRFNYKRICKVINYSFYKNIALVISLFLYNFYNGQSGAPLFESFVMAGWNFFLATPIIVIGVFDQDILESVALKFPKLYRASQCDSDLNLKMFAQTIVNSVIHALICFWVCYLCYNPLHGLFLLGTVFYSALLATMKLKVVLLTLSWNKYHVIFILFSIFLYFFFLFVYPHMTFLSYDMYGVPMMMFKEQLYWSLIVICPVGALLMDFTFMTLQQQFRPRSEDILREMFSPTSKNGRTSVVANKADIFPANYSNSTNIEPVALLPQQTITSAQTADGYDITNATLNGFAFNALDKGPKGSKDRELQELVTMRVQRHNDSRFDSAKLARGSPTGVSHMGMGTPRAPSSELHSPKV